METTASFRLLGKDGLDAAAVSACLGIEPSRSFEAGTGIRPRPASLRDSSAWILQSSSEIEAGVELEVQLRRLLEVLEPLTAKLWELVENGYWANWLCYVASNPAEHAVELESDVLTRLLRLPGDLWLDVCGDG